MSEETYVCKQCGKEYDNPQSVRSHQRIHKDASYKDPETLNNLYHGEEMTLEEVSEEVGCSVPTLRKWMGKFGIETRGHMEAVKVRWKHEPPEFTTGKNGYEIFRTNYEGEQLKFRHHRLIAVALYGYDAVVGNEVHHKSGVEWDNRHDNLEVLPTAEHMDVHWEDNLQSREKRVSECLCESFRQEYPDRTFKEIGERYDRWQGTVHYHVSGKCRH